MKVNNKKWGFTLIELLIAMVILGILTTIAASSYSNTRIKARDVKRKHDLEQVQKALEMYFNDTEHYPVSPLVEFAFGGQWIKNQGTPMETIYMSKVPGSNAEYCYESDGTGSYYRLFAILENERDPSIAETGCDAGCSCGGNTFNYKTTSSNVL